MDCLEWQSILAGARPWTAGAGFNREVLSRHGRHSRLICFQGIKMLLENHYQNAYVTRDIEQALDIFRTRYGVQDARFFQSATEVWTPQGSAIGRASCRERVCQYVCV